MASTSSSISSSSSSTFSSSSSVCCAACKAPILDRWMLKAIGQEWHEDCLKCACCQCRLGELGSKLYYKQGMMLCARDYLRLFGSTGVCAVCETAIPAFELVMRARGNVYHLHCFACHVCNHRFCVGDRYYLWDNKQILCQYDYEERLTFQSAGYNRKNFSEISRNIQEMDFDLVQNGNGNNGLVDDHRHHRMIAMTSTR